MTQLRIDNRHDRMLDQSSQAAHDYEEFKEQFGNDSVVIVAVSGKPLFEFDSLDAMTAVADRLAELPHVRNVNGIPTIFRETFGEEDNEALEEEMTSTPFYEGLFLSKDHTVAGILLELDVMNEPSAREELAEALDEAVQPLRDFGFRVDLVGGPVFETAIDKLTLSESRKMFPIAAAGSLVVLIALLRSVRATAAVLVSGAVILLLTMGLIRATGHTLNLVTASMPLILWVLSLSNCIHFVSRFQRLHAEYSDPGEAARRALGELNYALIICSVTTAVGFLSLVVSVVSAVRELGFYMACGLLITLIVCLFLTPWLCVKFKVKPSTHTHRTSRMLDTLARAVIRQPKATLALVGLLVMAGIYFAAQVKSQPDPVAFLPHGHEVAEAYDFVAEHLTGLESLEIVLDTPEGWTNEAYWPAIQTLIENVQSHPIVSRVYSPLDMLKKINQWDHDFDTAYYRLPESTEEADELLARMPDEDRDQIDRFSHDDGKRIRLSVLMNSRNSEAFEEVITEAQQSIGALPAPLTGSITGMAARMHEFEYGLVKTQVSSYLASFGMVFLTILIGLRSLRITLLSMPSNIVPMLGVFATMGLVGIELNVATVMVASISLGIAVDNTLHLIASFMRLRKEGHSTNEAILGTVSEVGPACVVTSITASIGFFVLCLSAFGPIGNFGLLCGVAMIVALAADFIMVPAILALGNSGRK